LCEIKKDIATIVFMIFLNKLHANFLQCPRKSKNVNELNYFLIISGISRVFFAGCSEQLFPVRLSNHNAQSTFRVVTTIYIVIRNKRFSYHSGAPYSTFNDQVRERLRLRDQDLRGIEMLA